VLQTLRGHSLQVIALAFDSERIISISGDNTVRYWQWGQQTAPSDKVHVLDKGETLLSVAKRYRCVTGCCCMCNFSFLLLVSFYLNIF